MSLFKTQDFWSFDLSQLASVVGSSFDGITDVEDERSVYHKGFNGSEFVVRVATFEVIGEYDVFVCGCLSGLLCIVQVPSCEQPKVDENQETPFNFQDQPHASRQLLLAERFPHTIVDLKCGRFVSTLKTSIAVLSFNEFTISQPVRRKLDLLTNDGTMDASLTFQLETICRIELPAVEIAYSLVTPSDCKELRINQDRVDKSRKLATIPSKSHSNTNPQKDLIIVRYMNQFAMSLFDGKKLIGNFRFVNETLKLQDSSNPNDTGICGQESQIVGPTLAVFVNDSRANQIIVSLSDNRLYCISVETFLKQAKHDVVKRVALSLSNQIPKTQPSPGDEADNSFSLIDLDSDCTWTYELLFAPVEMLPLRRKSKNLSLRGSKMNESFEQVYGQVLVRSRFSLDLISSSGDLVWSQRFEAQIICLETYFVKESTSKVDTDNDNFGSNATGYADRLMILACFDCLNETQSRLLVLEEKQTVWFSMLSSRPTDIWRMNLDRIKGILASLDFRQALLSVSYLGTNVTPSVPEARAKPEGLTNIVAQLAAGLDDRIEPGDSEHDAEPDYSGPKLNLDIQLEAFDQYPDTRVEMKIQIRPEKGSLSVFRNLTCRLDYDDLLMFNSDLECKSSHLSAGLASFELGSCWPDQRDPISVWGTFKLRSSNTPTEDINHPKSLMVRVVVGFSENRLGLRVQETIFHLPLTLIASLAHLDYTNSPGHSLTDFQANLNLYKRKGLSPVESQDEERETSMENTQKQSPYYLSDFFLKTHEDLLHLVDELIESDLVCRGLNFECKDYWKCRSDSAKQKLSTMENLNLLALSLNCRLKLKPNPSSRIERQVSEDDLSPIVMISIGLRMPSGTKLMGKNCASGQTNDHPFSLVWIHLCDMSNSDLELPKNLIEQHMKEWKIYELARDQNICKTDSSLTSLRPVLLTIESEHLYPLLFVQTHILQRLENVQVRAKIANSATDQIIEQPIQFMMMDDSLHDLITIDSREFNALGNFIAISENFHDRLKEFLINNYKRIQSECTTQVDQLKNSFNSFRESSLSSITMAKNIAKLSGSPESLESYLTAHKIATSQQQYLTQTLQRLDEIKSMDFAYSKLPNGAGYIKIESDEKGQFIDWPDFVPLLG